MTPIKQKTIKKTVSYSGVGIHSGKKVNLTIKPAPPNHGIKFSRTDIPYSTSIPAFFKMVVDTSLATVIGMEGVIVSTIEHLMAAFLAFGIDNAIVEVDSYEMPIIDGSAIKYVEMFEEAGVVDLKSNKFFFKIKKKVKIKESDTFVEIRPYEGFKITSTTIYPHPLIKKQKVEFEITPDNFKKEIAPARTFGFFKDFSFFKQCGLAKGASTDTCIALSEDGIINDTKLRFPNEFARHKLLDCIGDSALLGMPILGHITAYKTGHAFNHNFLKELFENKSAWETIEIIK